MDFSEMGHKKTADTNVEGNRKEDGKRMGERKMGGKRENLYGPKTATAYKLIPYAMSKFLKAKIFTLGQLYSCRG